MLANTKILLRLNCYQDINMAMTKVILCGCIISVKLMCSIVSVKLYGRMVDFV